MSLYRLALLLGRFRFTSLGLKGRSYRYRYLLADADEAAFDVPPSIQMASPTTKNLPQDPQAISNFPH